MSLLSGVKSAVSGIAPRLTKMHFDPEKMSVEDIELPTAIKNYDADIRANVKEEIDTYKALGYKDMPIDQLKFPEYHSYQVGLLLKYIKDDKVYVFDDIDKVLNSVAINTTKRNLHIKVFDMVHRYNQFVDKGWRKEELEDDKKWTPMEISYLLRYATFENRAI